MSNKLDDLSELAMGFTKIDLPGGGGGETDSPVVEAAIAVGILGAAAYGIYKLFGRAEPQKVFERAEPVNVFGHAERQKDFRNTEPQKDEGNPLF